MPAISIGNAASGGLGYPFPSNLWPVTQAEADDTFAVCEFNSSGNETLAGLGLSGSALVLPAVNGPGNYDGEGRSIAPSSNQALKMPPELFNAWYNSAFSPRGFGWLGHFKGCSTGSDGSIMFNVLGFDASGNPLLQISATAVYGTRYSLNLNLERGPDGDTEFNLSRTVYIADKFPASDHYWIALSYREAVGNLPAYAMIGWKAGATQPGGFGECDHYSIWTPPIDEMVAGDFTLAYGHDRTAACTAMSDSSESFIGSEWTFSDTAGFKVISITLGRVPFGEL